MKKWMMSIILLALFVCVPFIKSDAVMRTLGSQANCDTTIASCIAFPTQVTTLCVTSCPERISFSYTDSNRLWGISSVTAGCSTSTNGGSVWAACTTDPFDPAFFTYNGIAGASDGSTIAWGSRAGPSECTAKRSINNGTTWTQVYTEVRDCRRGGLEGAYVYCTANGQCEFLDYSGGNFTPYRSSNNGQSWTAGTPITTFIRSAAGGSWNGNVGIVMGAQPLTSAVVFATGDSWADSGNTWDGTSGDCWGNATYNGNGIGICFAATNYTARTTTGALLANLILPEALLIFDSGGVAYGYATNTLYVLTSSAESKIYVYVSRDNLATFTLIGKAGTTNLRGGNMIAANGCIYFAAGATRLVGKIC